MSRAIGRDAEVLLSSGSLKNVWQNQEETESVGRGSAATRDRPAEAWLEQKPNGRFHVAFRFAGQKLKKSLRTADSEAAHARLHRLEENIRLVESGRLAIPEDEAGELRPFDGVLAFLDPLLRSTATVVELHDVLRVLVQVGRDEPDAGKQLTRVPFRSSRPRAAPAVTIWFDTGSCDKEPSVCGRDDPRTASAGARFPALARHWT